jgi:hypothetical protein
VSAVASLIGDARSFHDGWIDRSIPMSSEVRVHVRLGAIRLDYEGDRTFYERHVERLVDAAARAGKASVGAPPSGNGRSEAHAPAEAPAPVAAAAAPGATAERARAAGFVPQSGDFGRFLRRLGPEAGEPDRQVAAFAFYLWNYEKRETFRPEEVEGCFRAIGLPAPPDLSVLLEDLTERRRFLESAEPGTWRLSRKGENYVKTRLLTF